jgi:hypothetical protein
MPNYRHHHTLVSNGKVIKFGTVRQLDKTGLAIYCIVNEMNRKVLHQFSLKADEKVDFESYEDSIYWHLPGSKRVLRKCLFDESPPESGQTNIGRMRKISSISATEVFLWDHNDKDKVHKVIFKPENA